MTQDGPALLRPGDPAYEAARAPAVARFRGIPPRAVARCASPEEVPAAIAYARRERLPLAARSGGHCFAGRSSTDGLLIDVSPLRSVAVHDDGTATVGAGTRLGDLYDA